MVSTLDDTKCSAIAAKLAEMKLVQELPISNEQKLTTMISDEDLRKRLSSVLEDD